MPDVEIVRKYNSETRGLYNYYRLASNVSILNQFDYIMNGRLPILADIGVEAIARMQDISGQVLLGGNHVNCVFIFHGFGPRSVNICLIGK